MIRRVTHDGPHTAIFRRVGSYLRPTSADEVSYFITLATLFTIGWTFVLGVYLSTLSTALT